ncbi:alpha-amylase family protein [Halomonas sp. 18H]|uniref:alpha-amylase n=1 Tax=Halomonas almeriensis TaxID=308163 RepID=UPI0022318F90|nr:MULTISPECIES: alpha-amylase family protein [Halomonas]MCW4152810.1 alpha-amylase family protein [Halomonas sp. 18H]MDN3551991.1 alpha-amylase family protein [Halomonas almeriensis]
MNHNNEDGLAMTPGKNSVLLALTATLAAQGAFAASTPSSTEPQEPVMVHLFEWRWDDVARECETHLGPSGIDAVQISPANEHIALDDVEGAWWARYQPVSYQLESRSGDREAFTRMIKRCADAGVDIIADAVINHMAGIGEGVGIAGTPYSPFEYGELYQRDDFHHCGRHDNDQIQNYQDRYEVQHCHLLGLADLATDRATVRDRIADYLQSMLDLGVAGLRIDAAKHMPAQDIAAILERLEGQPAVFQEVIDPGNEPIRKQEYAPTADVTEFGYSHELAQAISQGNLARLKTLGQGESWLSDDKAIVFVDNHDKQRGHVGGGMLMHRDTLYPLANTFMLAWPYGTPKLMSSYTFDNGDQGPPTQDGDSNWKIRRVHGDTGMGCLARDNLSARGWVCEHRWDEMVAMLGFRRAVGDAPVVNWQQDGKTRIAFSRGDRGFLAMNRDSDTWKAELDTGLSGGQYCNLLDDCETQITVDDDGRAKLTIAPDSALALQVDRQAPSS